MLMFMLPSQTDEMWTGIYSGGRRALSQLTGAGLAPNGVPNLFLVQWRCGFVRVEKPECLGRPQPHTVRYCPLMLAHEVQEHRECMTLYLSPSALAVTASHLKACVPFGSQRQVFTTGLYCSTEQLNHALLVRKQLLLHLFSSFSLI